MALLSELFAMLPPLPAGDDSSPSDRPGDHPPVVARRESFQPEAPAAGKTATIHVLPVGDRAGGDQPGHPPRTLTAATASPDWLLARDQYMGHLMTCPACYAPTGRYCATGADLRQQYQLTPMEPTP